MDDLETTLGHWWGTVRFQGVHFGPRLVRLSYLINYRLSPLSFLSPLSLSLSDYLSLCPPPRGRTPYQVQTEFKIRAPTRPEATWCFSWLLGTYAFIRD